MFSLSRPLGRLPFFAGLSAVNITIAGIATVALTMLPARGASLAVLVIMAALQGVWLVLHARRFADAGRGAGVAVGFALAGFAIFALGYLISAALWSVPEVQQEAFRTAGGIGGGARVGYEANPALADAGRAMAAVLGAAGALIVTGLIAMGFLIVAAISAVFSTVALMLPGGAGRGVPPLPPQGAKSLPR